MITFYEYRGNYLHVFSCIQNHLYFEKHWIIKTCLLFIEIIEKICGKYIYIYPTLEIFSIKYLFYNISFFLSLIFICSLLIIQEKHIQ